MYGRMLTDGADQAACGMFAKPVAGVREKRMPRVLAQPAKLYGSPCVMVPAGKTQSRISTCAQ